MQHSTFNYKLKFFFVAFYVVCRSFCLFIFYSVFFSLQTGDWIVSLYAVVCYATEVCHLWRAVATPVLHTSVFVINVT